MNIMERVIIKVRPNRWKELEKLELEYEVMEREWGFPTMRRYRPGASGMNMDVLIIEREWESYAAREKAYEKAMANKEWHILGRRSHSISESVQAEFFHPLLWNIDSLKELPEEETIAGRPVIAHLPNGMDVIK
jgi:hypothetical protein